MAKIISRTPKQFFILVSVTFPNGTPKYTFQFLADPTGNEDASKCPVAPGDQVGWYVVVQASSGLLTPAYELDFPDSSLFGTETVSVPRGGASGFFTVLSPLAQSVKYNLKVSGISPASDPFIQVDPNGILGFGPRATTVVTTGVTYVVLWTVSTNTMQYQKNGGALTNFPAAGLPVSVGDVLYVLGSAGGGAAAGLRDRFLSGQQMGVAVHSGTEHFHGYEFRRCSEHQ